ncbi:Phenylacetic acid degradation protein PaaD thioesterase [Paramagnetospirillum magnetotacticum MS-1]|uniref:Medium/long-chain acyl-CoA thioesterase YigI n=1 Tax=Paramagnetospirillum magnetotacticum MS-1 TaxID=272627 RepID=A0A0C2YX51_PARME|nr:PaaI family thioesterase [Paramagnetospirillum magnetotacticum]KIL99260.1 Phenylacetic acid degradation protein PaaD thioesterase [Paramagnetospirillum magnetotacticum MS-1]
MAGFAPKDPDYRGKVKASFARQAFLATIGASMTELEPGRCTLEMPTRPDLAQQHGFVHAGATTTLADTAAGYAAFSLMPSGSAVLTTEFKVNLLNPAKGEKLVARAEVLKSGRTLVVVRSDVYGIEDGCETMVATMLATMICLAGASDPA